MKNKFACIISIPSVGEFIMNTVIIFDSIYGNTEKIAQAIGSAFSPQGQPTLLRVSDVKPEHWQRLDLLIVGSPTQRFRPTPQTSTLLDGLPPNSLSGVKVAAFDTRLTWEEIRKTPVLAFSVKLVGNAYAAKPIADSLKKKGGKLILPPEGFFVEGMEGPLKTGEVDRATAWAHQLISNLP
jgi:flavodoxin I